MSRAQLTSTVEQNTGGAVVPLVAGKNKIINGDFNIWQRGTSITGNGAATYTADRWAVGNANTIARSTDIPTGFVYSANWTTSGSYPTFTQSIELPATATKGQFVGNWTLSFWAKASTALNLVSGLGWTDDSPRNNQVGIAEIGSSVTTSWAKYTITYNLSSTNPVSTNKALSLYFYVVSGGANVYITGVQFEQGPVSTPFTTASGTLQGELALCQRYYYRVGGSNTNETFGVGLNKQSTTNLVIVNLPVQMRVAPTSLDFANLQISDNYTYGTSITACALFNNGNSKDSPLVEGTVSGGLTTGQMSFIRSAATTNGYLGFSAEL
jgi:hypothetical protein